MKFTPLMAFTVVMCFLFLGEWVSTRTRSYLPSIFISALLFVIGFWTVLPKTVVTMATFGDNFSAVVVGLLLVHLGTLMNLRQLAA